MVTVSGTHYPMIDTWCSVPVNCGGTRYPMTDTWCSVPVNCGRYSVPVDWYPVKTRYLCWAVDDHLWSKKLVISKLVNQCIVFLHEIVKRNSPNLYFYHNKYVPWNYIFSLHLIHPKQTPTYLRKMILPCFHRVVCIYVQSSTSSYWDALKKPVDMS